MIPLKGRGIFAIFQHKNDRWLEREIIHALLWSIWLHSITAFLQKKKLFTFWLWWVFVMGFSSGRERRLLSTYCCAGFSCFSCFEAEAVGAWASLVMHRLSCFMVCGVFPDQGSNLYSLHWKWILSHWTTRVFVHWLLFVHLKWSCT